MNALSTHVDTLLGVLEHCSDMQVVGINGLDCAGKSTLAHSLQEACIQRDIDADLIHVDAFNNAVVQDKIYAAHASGQFAPELMEEYYHSSIDYSVLFAAIEAEKLRDTSIIIVEGVFLFRPPVDSLLDYRVFLDVPAGVAKERYVRRKVQVGDSRPVTVFDDIWLPAFERYCLEFAPKNLADKVFIHPETE